MIDKELRLLNELEQKKSELEKTPNKTSYKEIKKIESLIAYIQEIQNTFQKIQDIINLSQTEHDTDLLTLIEEDRLLEENKLTKQQDELNEILAKNEKEKDEINSIILEIRSGTGGDEAGLFANDLLKAYLRYAENNNWTTKICEISKNEAGGIRSCAISIKGDNVYNKLMFESGTHRVQRIPATEANGRIHTSTATVAVLPEPKDVDIVINEKDLRVDTYCASGAGGQHVNKTESAVRITHIPTGLVVQCQDERSQHSNYDRALSVLRARLYQLKLQQLQKDRDNLRQKHIGGAERSEKIRTYNYPQNRITDHRFDVNLRRLDYIMLGNLDELFDPINASYNTMSYEDKMAIL